MKLIEITDLIPDVIIDLRYATENNITGRKLYKTGESAMLDSTVAAQLATAAAVLRKQSRRLVIWDAYRPQQVQAELLADNPNDHETYILTDSNHPKGRAVDLTLADSDGTYLLMGTDFDEFSEKARANYEDLTKQELDNRTLLRKAMEEAGFTVWPYEWWHFNYDNKD
jgi:D-alanyl-D-alanine dipeptidase